MRNVKLKVLLLGLIIINSSILSSKPIGTIKINDSTYFDETEVTLGTWLSYYTWVLEHEGLDSAQKVLPNKNAIDPNVWNYIVAKSNVYNDVLISSAGMPVGFFCKSCEDSKVFGKRIRQISNNCGYLTLPVTGISYEQVVGFCEWRTRLTGDNKYIFRLPTLEEWKNFAILSLNKIDSKIGFQDSLYKGKCPIYNYKVVNCNCNNDSVNGKLNSVGLFEPGDKGGFDIFGNLSEMTSIKGVAKGGNFTLFANQCHPDSTQFYTKSESWLGFRCIVVVKSNKEISSSINTSHLDLKKDSVSKFKINGKLGELTDSRDGKTYRVVKIGEQIWMAENLSYKPEKGKYWIYDWNDENLKHYGYLYGWKTSQNVCPTDWHLPSKEEFETLLSEVSKSDSIQAYSKLISGGDSDFSMLYGGLRIGWGAYYNSNWVTLWSSSKDTDSGMVWILNFDGDKSKVDVRKFKVAMMGFPVRCLKNEENK